MTVNDLKMGQQVKIMREKIINFHYHQMIHDPNGMQMIG